MQTYYDKIIIGAGLYGLYAAVHCAEKGERVLILEQEDAPFTRATYINQARVHMGYHYPRSLSTALKSAHYFNRFIEDFRFCIAEDFDQIYATSSDYSWTNAEQFQAFCHAANIRCETLDPAKYFKPGLCDGAFLTREYTYDAQLLRDHFLNQIERSPQITLLCNAGITRIIRADDQYIVFARDGGQYHSSFVLNTTYASSNQIMDLLYRGNPECFPPDQRFYFPVKYELCEIILCRVNEALRHTGITVMDGPFFSIMPFGKTSRHSLTAVSSTPHMACYESFPHFSCQKNHESCTPYDLRNCDDCPEKPGSAWPYMSTLAHKFLRDEFSFTYERSLFSMKPILRKSEMDDSRPTIIRTITDTPAFLSVLSGKINTIYDLDEVL